MTHVRTHTFVTLANPFLICGNCRRRIARLHDPIRCGCHGERWLTECGHDAAAESICPTWGPVDGCRCTPECTVPETVDLVDHQGNHVRTVDVTPPVSPAAAVGLEVEIDNLAEVLATGLEPFGGPDVARPAAEHVALAGWGRPSRHNEAIHELTNALRLTVEYVGLETLMAKEGWSWFDALEKYAPEMAARLQNPADACWICKGSGGEHDGAIHDARGADMPLAASTASEATS